MYASGRNSVAELPNVDISEYLNLPKFVVESSREKVFDLLTEDVYQSLTTWVVHCKEVDNEVKALKISQTSNLKSVQQDIDCYSKEIVEKQSEIKKLNRAIRVQGYLLFSAFVAFLLALGLVLFIRGIVSSL